MRIDLWSSFCLSAQAGYFIQEQMMVKFVHWKSLGNKIYVNNFQNKKIWYELVVKIEGN